MARGRSSPGPCASCMPLFPRPRRERGAGLRQSDFDELRAALAKLKEEHGKITATWGEWDAKTKAEYFDLVGGTTGRPPDVEVEPCPWDEPDEGEKLRASARPPPTGAGYEGGPLALPAAYSRPGQGAAAPRRVHVQERVPAPSAAALHDGGPQQELARPRRGARRGGLRGIAVCSSWQEGQGACRGQVERARHAAWREVWRSASWRCLSQDGAGAFLNATPMRDDMRMETWVIYSSYRLFYQRECPSR